MCGEVRYWIYMMSNVSGNVLYIGVTNNLYRRFLQHYKGEMEGFTKRYKCHCLVYYEEFSDIRIAIAREKELKGWRRERKEELIHFINPTRLDFAKDWGWI